MHARFTTFKVVDMKLKVWRRQRLLEKGGQRRAALFAACSTL